MPLRAPAFLLVVVSSSLFSLGCIPEKVRTLAAPDLQCPPEKVDVVGGSGSYVARGCGKWVQYECVDNGMASDATGVSCFPRPHPEVHDDRAR